MASNAPSPFLQEEWVEWLIWITYISGEFWIFGLTVSLPVGCTLYGWLITWGSWNLIEALFLGVGDFMIWLEGPFRRAAVGSGVIFPLYISSTFILGWNFISSFLFLWWALADYFDYKFDPIFGERPEEFQWGEGEGEEGEEGEEEEAESEE